MIRFARLLDDLVFSPSRTAKLRLMREYFAAAPDPDRGFALAALTGTLEVPHVVPSVVRRLAESRVDPVLFALSYDFVGDLAETTALIWPASVRGGSPPPTVAEVVETLHAASKPEVPDLLAGWLDRLDAGGRWALLKLLLGSLRVGVSARLAKTALAELGAVEVSAVEEVWHGLEPPYAPLFGWLEGGAAPELGRAATFRPLMLAHPLEEAELSAITPDHWRAEWKWDGIRVQVVAMGGSRRLFSRTGDEVGSSFPDVLAAMDFEGVLDGELLVGHDRPGQHHREAAPFNDLQQRLNRKAPTARMVAELPAFVRLYDILFDGPEDLRPLPFDHRRARLERFWTTNLWTNPRFDVSPLVPFADADDLAGLRAEAMARGAEGLMLKRADSPYLAGRPKGLWYKWKREPNTVDAVMVYAQRGHGKRSSFYSDYTFACWRARPEGGEELVPVAKAYFGFTDEELARLDRWVRAHTTKRFGPVREVEPRLVVELAFDAVQRSARHKSGLALRFPRVKRIRWDKPAAEADRLEALERLVSPSAASPPAPRPGAAPPR